MHIGLNCVFLVPGETGGLEVYALELAGALAELPGRRVTAFVSRDGADRVLPDGVERVEVPVHARNRLEWVRGEQLLLPGLARRAGIDVLHSLGSTAPARGRFARVVTIHDLLYRLVPETHFGVRGLGMRVLVPLAARSSHAVIATSRSTRDDLVSLLGLAPERVDVIAFGPGQTPRATPLPERSIRERFALGDRPVVLSLSAKRPHKNLGALLRAVSLIEAGDRPITVLPGFATPHEAQLRALAATLGIAEEVRFCGWLEDEELEGLFAVARAFVFPSLYEGFGLPVLEAMVRGVPVTCSARGPLPEVVGDAALLFDPEDPREIADAVRRLVADAALRERLVAAGRERLTHFSWLRTARETAGVYERVLARPA